LPYTTKDVRIMVRKKVTVSLSSRCLQLIDQFAETTGFESRSRVIEEAIFAITELIGYREIYSKTLNQPKEDTSQSFGEFLTLLARFATILNRFERFQKVPQKQASEKTYRYVPVQEREKRE